MKNVSFKNLICLYKNTNGNTEKYLEDQIHLNIWETQKSFVRYSLNLINFCGWLSFFGYHSKTSLDIGLKIDLNKNNDSIQFILPWETTTESVDDLSNQITDNDALRAIFNEHYEYADKGVGSTVSLGQEVLFNIVKLSIGKDAIISIEKKSFDKTKECSILTIDLKKIAKILHKFSNNTKIIYLRFRLKDLPTSFYRVNLKPLDRIFNSATTITQIIDFRVNVQRDIPTKLWTEVIDSQYQILPFSKMHLFIMKPLGEKIIFENKDFKACRSLENEEYWAKYSGYDTKYVKKSLGYQWSNSDPNKTSDGWNVLSKFESVRLGVIAYLITLLLAGALGGILGNYLYNYFFPSTIPNVMIEAPCKPYVPFMSKYHKEVTE